MCSCKKIENAPRRNECGIFGVLVGYNYTCKINIFTRRVLKFDCKLNQLLRRGFPPIVEAAGWGGGRQAFSLFSSGIYIFNDED